MDTCEKCGGDIPPDDDHHTIIDAEADELDCQPGNYHEGCCPRCGVLEAVAHG